MNVLHVGCGGGSIPEGMFPSDAKEVRLDIDPRAMPDIVASMTSMGDIGAFDAVFSCHSLEHLHEADVARALREFLRVLKPGGFAVIIVPDLEGVVPDERVLYVSEAGPVRGLDLFYGMARYLEEGPHMAHKTGFIVETLTKRLLDAGFSGTSVRRVSHHQLLGVGMKGAAA